MNWQGRAYDVILEPLLAGPRRSIARRVAERRLVPFLDICCGTGAQCGQVAGRGGFAVGLDIDFALLKYAASRHPRVLFVCADAARLPFRSRSFRGVGISFGLHDKPPDVRKAMVVEAKRILAGQGRAIVLDFENPWSFISRVGHLLISGIERLAGREHFRNGRHFLAAGGLQAFLAGHGLSVLERRVLEPGSSAVAVSTFSGTPGDRKRRSAPHRTAAASGRIREPAARPISIVDP